MNPMHNDERDKLCLPSQKIFNFMKRGSDKIGDIDRLDHR